MTHEELNRMKRDMDETMKRLSHQIERDIFRVDPSTPMPVGPPYTPPRRGLIHRMRDGLRGFRCGWRDEWPENDCECCS